MRILASPLRVVVLAAVAVVSTVAPSASADDCATVTRDNVAACAARASATIRAEREAVSAATGRRTAAAPLLPSNPVVAVSAARRAGTEGRSAAMNLYAALAQEVDLSGTRSAFRREADADVMAHGLDLVAVTRRTVAGAYRAYFDAVAARDALEVAGRLARLGDQVARVVAARAEAGVASPLDAELAETARLRLAQGRIASERALGGARAALAAALGRDPVQGTLEVAGALEPLSGSDALARTTRGSAVRARPEVRARETEERAFEARADAFRRARIPSVTFQVYAQNDGYDERVLGAGLSIPVPLPQPVGRFYTGEIAEAEANARRARAESDIAARELSLDLARAAVAWHTRRAEAELYDAARAARAERLLEEVGREIESGRLGVRDALLAQQQLVDVLRGRIETRHALCLTSVELALAAGVPLEGGPR